MYESIDSLGYAFDDFMLNFGGILLIAAILFTVIAQARVTSVFSRYSKVLNQNRMTGADVARLVLTQNGVSNVRIERVSGNLTDHYDPRTNVIRLSDTVYDKATPAAAGVAAHEAGHAVQYARSYLPVKIRSAIIPVTNFASKWATPLLIIGFLLSFTPLIWLGIIAFSASVVFQLVTLPCEFDASHRAMDAISCSGRFSDSDESAARKTLTAAAMTYVAALSVSLVYLLRYIAIARRRR